MPAADSRRWWALGALSLSVLVVALDLFVLTLALPTVSADLHASSSELQWFVDAYSLVLAAALLPAGLLGDRVGRKRLLIGALALFGAASLACAYSTSASQLIAARAVLGLAAAVILPMSLAVLPVLFTAAERPRAIAAVGGATFLGYPIGPIFGGWLLDHFWWGSVFLINIPVVVIAVGAVAMLMRESRGEFGSRLDLTGIVLSSAGLTMLTYGLIKAGEDGWTDPTAVATMAAGIVALAGFVGWERRLSQGHSAQQGDAPQGDARPGDARPGDARPGDARPGDARPGDARPGDARPGDARPGDARSADRALPLVDLTLFGSAGFTWGTMLSTLVSFALFGLVFAMPQYFLDVRGLDSLGAGLRMLPMIGGLAIGLAIGQRLQTPRRAGRDSVSTIATVADSAPGTGRTATPPVSPKILVAVGFAIMAAALATGTATTVSSGTGFAAAWFAMTGFGLGIAMPTALNAAIGALSRARSGSGSALITAMRQVGGTIGVAVLGTVLATVYRGQLHLAGLQPAAVTAVRRSVAQGVAAAQATGSSVLLQAVRAAYVHGLDIMLWVCSAIAIVSAVLALAFLPSRSDGPPDLVSAPDPGDCGTAATPPALDKSTMTP